MGGLELAEFLELTENAAATNLHALTEKKANIFCEVCPD